MASPADKKLSFQVVFASSEDPDYPVTELNFHSPQTRGWQSARFCEFPQEIGLQFTDHGGVAISQIQLLSHQCKIATRIELYVGAGSDDYFRASFTRLGYLSLDSNERSQYKARELKSVYLKARGTFLKLIVHKCHVNPQNIFNQVGLIAVNVLGQPASALAGGVVPLAQPKGVVPYAGATAAAAPVGLSGTAAVTGGMRAGVNDLSVDLGLDPETAALLREVAARKERAVADEDFEGAKRLKALQESIRAVGGHLAALVSDKARAVEAEDYDRAISIKQQITRIRSGLMDKLVECGLRAPPPGYVPPHMGGGGGGGGHGGSDGGEGGGYRHRESRGLGGGAPSGAAPGGGHDDVPVGGGGGGYGVEGADRTVGGYGGGEADAGGSPASGRYGGGGDTLDAFGRPVSRAIRPAASGTFEALLDAEVTKAGPGGGRGGRSPARGGGGSGAASAAEGDEAGGSGEEGEEPAGPRGDAAALAGVPGAEELPPPEPLTSAAEKEGAPIIDAFGEYVTRCYYSRQWQLREAAVAKMALEVGNVAASGSVPKQALLTTCLAVASAVTAKDKIAHVFAAVAGQLLPAALSACCAGGGMRRADVHGALDSTGIVSGLVERGGDNTPRIRDAAMSALLDLAGRDYVGPVYVAHHVVRKLSKKQAGQVRPVLSRLEILTGLVERADLLSAPSFPVEALVTYCEEHNTFSHANGDLRRATQDLFAQAQRFVPVSRIIPLLQPHLRPKQQDEYQAAFAAASAAAGGAGAAAGGVGGDAEGGAAGGVPASRGSRAAPTASAAHSPASAAASSSSAAPSRGGAKKAAEPAGPAAAGGRRPGGALSPAAAAAAAPHHHHDDEAGETSGASGAGGGTCQFCGGCGPDATEPQLDLHYWQDCPMLMPCPKCTQVIEVATLHEHLLDECEKKESFEPCPTCADAIPVEELEAHVAAAGCAPLPDPAVAQRCSLCSAEIGPGKEGWTQHLLVALCPKNPRTRAPAAATAAASKPGTRSGTAASRR